VAFRPDEVIAKKTKICYYFPIMKTGIHPEYFNDAKVSCACGNTFTVGATRKEIKVEICSDCHPFYTGNEKVLDTAGRVEKFKARSAVAKAMADKQSKSKKS
jgi:large subunit ribosomal protein L31